jgi:2-dehydro-3-deoxy-D-arabinonate dehydratase
MKLYRTRSGAVVEENGAFAALPDDWDALIARADLVTYLAQSLARFPRLTTSPTDVLAPIASQEVWAAGVTYLRSKTARIEESQAAGGGSFYDRVYEAQRPELFFKAAGWRVRGPGGPVRIRRDATWSVPEPEVALYINPRGDIIGFTIGNDLSSRDIEGENPLYLPQAKIYDGSCALGPAVLITGSLPADTTITLRVTRARAPIFEGTTRWSRLRRAPRELVEWLYRETSFPHGCVLLTGTGIIPPDAFTLCPGDEIEIGVSAIGVLRNIVESA